MVSLETFTRDPFGFLLLSVGFIYSLVFHEVAHAGTAAIMGDSTARDLGRLSLNPLKHLDIVGTLLLFFVGFGWAKPVPINVENFRARRFGFILVSAAGVLTNFLLACAAPMIAILLWTTRLLPLPEDPSILDRFIAANVSLAAFNLIPIPPLDGFKILKGVLPIPSRFFMRFERFGFFILIGLLSFRILDPVTVWLMKKILAVIRILLEPLIRLILAG